MRHEDIPDALLEAVYGPVDAAIPMPFHGPCAHCLTDTDDRDYFKHPKCHKTICARCIQAKNPGKPRCPHCDEPMIMPRS